MGIKRDKDELGMSTKARRARQIGFNLDLAQRAHAGTSFVPERRAVQRLNDVRNELAGVWRQGRKIAKTPAQREVLKNEMARYRQGLLSHHANVLAADSRTLSTMITGPAKFNTRRNEKANNAAMNKTKELLDWNQRARGAVMRAISNAATPEQNANMDWEFMRKDIDRNIATVRNIDAGKEPYRRSAFTGSIQGKLIRAANNGQADLVKKALDYIGEKQKEGGKPFFAKNNSVWKLGATAEATKAADIAKVAEAHKTPEVASKSQFKGVDVVENKLSDRLELRFPGKPSDAVRTDLKSRGFRWSPNAGAWQRQLTGNAREAADSVLSKHFERAAPSTSAPANPAPSTSAPTQQAKVESAVDPRASAAYDKLNEELHPINRQLTEMAKTGKYGTPEYNALKARQSAIIDAQFDLHTGKNGALDRAEKVASSKPEPTGIHNAWNDTARQASAESRLNSGESEVARKKASPNGGEVRQASAEARSSNGGIVNPGSQTSSKPFDLPKGKPITPEMVAERDRLHSLARGKEVLERARAVGFDKIGREQDFTHVRNALAEEEARINRKNGDLTGTHEAKEQLLHAEQAFHSEQRRMASGDLFGARPTPSTLVAAMNESDAEKQRLNKALSETEARTRAGIDELNSRKGGKAAALKADWEEVQRLRGQVPHGAGAENPDKKAAIKATYDFNEKHGRMPGQLKGAEYDYVSGRTDKAPESLAGATTHDIGHRVAFTKPGFGRLSGIVQKIDAEGRVHVRDHNGGYHKLQPSEITRNAGPVPGEKERIQKLDALMAGSKSTTAIKPVSTGEHHAWDDKARAAASEVKAANKPAETPEHIQKMQDFLKKAKTARFKTASDETLEKLYQKRLEAKPEKFGVGHGVAWKVTGDQTNRGFRIAEIHPEDKMATIHQVADTGITSTGGDHDRIKPQRVYLAELKRERKYDAQGATKPAKAPKLSTGAPKGFANESTLNSALTSQGKSEKGEAKAKLSAPKAPKAASVTPGQYAKAEFLAGRHPDMKIYEVGGKFYLGDTDGKPLKSKAYDSRGAAETDRSKTLDKNRKFIGATSEPKAPKAPKPFSVEGLKPPELKGEHHAWDDKARAAAAEVKGTTSALEAPRGENYGANRVRAEARANILNKEDKGWVAREYNGEWHVHHDGVTPPPSAIKTPHVYSQNSESAHDIRMGSMSDKYHLYENGARVKDAEGRDKAFRSEEAAKKFAESRKATALKVAGGDTHAVESKHASMASAVKEALVKMPPVEKKTGRLALPKPTGETQATEAKPAKLKATKTLDTAKHIQALKGAELSDQAYRQAHDDLKTAKPNKAHLHEIVKGVTGIAPRAGTTVSELHRTLAVHTKQEQRHEARLEVSRNHVPGFGEMKPKAAATSATAPAKGEHHTWTKENRDNAAISKAANAPAKNLPALTKPESKPSLPVAPKAKEPEVVKLERKNTLPATIPAAPKTSSLSTLARRAAHDVKGNIGGLGAAMIGLEAGKAGYSAYKAHKGSTAAKLGAGAREAASAAAPAAAAMYIGGKAFGASHNVLAKIGQRAMAKAAEKSVVGAVGRAAALRLAGTALGSAVPVAGAVMMAAPAADALMRAGGKAEGFARGQNKTPMSAVKPTEISKPRGTAKAAAKAEVSPNVTTVSKTSSPTGQHNSWGNKARQMARLARMARASAGVSTGR